MLEDEEHKHVSVPSLPSEICFGFFSPQNLQPADTPYSQFYRKILTGGGVVTNMKQDARMGSVEQLYLWVVELSLPTSNHPREAQESRGDEQGETASSL